MKKTVLYNLFLTLLLAITACGTHKAYYAKNELDWRKAHSPDSLHLKYSIFLIGDAGKPDTSKQEPTLKLLQKQIYHRESASDTGNTSRKEDIVIFLGDNIYETGMPEPTASDRRLKERRIIEQMNVVKEIKGLKIFIPGNHDWNKSHDGGLAALKRQEDFIEQYLDSADVFLPSNGCAGPIELHPNKDLTLIILDSEWWLDKYDKNLDSDQGCSASTHLEVIQQVQDIVLRNKGKNILLAEHHPLFSNGNHGGYYTPKDYLFPLTLVRDNLYIPLPIIGAVYPLLRQYGISRQDLANKEYQQLKRGLLAVLGEEKNVVIAAGHEHGLQFHRYKDISHIVSGGGSKANPLVKGNDALFAHGDMGFARLNYYDNGQCWVEFWEPEGDGSTGKLMYRTPLYANPSKADVNVFAQKSISYKDSVKFIAAGEQYEAGNFKRKVFGEHYRDSWATPVSVPYLDLNTFAGGLTPVKMGGGNQTTSLQLQGKDKVIYQFRLIDKDPSKLLPEGFSKTLAEDILQDQISSGHPYGALMIPPMARAIGIYYTNPQLVYMPYSSLLGPYIQQIGGKLGIIEAKPDEDVSDFSSFGNAKNAVSTNTMYEKLRDDNDNEVDQRMYLKSRLFDIIIGDWDRHEDQWRWAEFKKDKGAIYRPIPRDRDQAFVKYDGLFPRIVSKLNPYFQSFEKDIANVADLGIGARDLDRNLLTKLTEQDWIDIANEVKTKLTDKVIETAVTRMPPEVAKISGAEITSKLKSRRDQLPDAAREYYKVLSKEVTIAGSDKKEFFHVERSKDATKVTVQKLDKDNKIDKKLYERTFLNTETSEINLYALDGKDSVIVEGSSSNPVKIRVVGGKGNDVINTTADANRTLFYDNTDDYTISEGPNTAIIHSKREWVNDYQPVGWFNYDQSGKVPSINITADDGIFIGLGLHKRHYGFKKDPYSFDQTILGNYAPKTNALTLKYSGDFVSLFARNTDVLVQGLFRGPQNTFNYFGEGNSTNFNNDNIDFYRIRTNTFQSVAYLQHRFTQAFRVGIGPGFEYYEILKTPGRITSQPTFTEISKISGGTRIGSVRSYANVDFVDDDIFPTAGVRWRNEVNFFNEFNQQKNRHLQLKSDLSFYATPNLNFPLTYAIRIGAAHNVGDYSFFQANSLGNSTNAWSLGEDAILRGYRNNRFTGRSYLYENSEVRLKLASLRNYIFTGDIGVTGFFDAGRVYSDLPESGKWHTGYGPGVWINLFRQFIISGSYGFSKEGQYINVTSGFFF
jgi:hypothetical protein